jgi:uncharacterized SAM-binding protein YcdF (DUF218 family)
MRSVIADWLTSAGLGQLKPVLSALLLPPAPWLVLALAGAGLTRRCPRTARGLVVLACVGTWLCSCIGAARWVEESWLSLPTPLSATQRAQLKARAAAGEHLAIVVLGGGVDPLAREYGGADLASPSLFRLRYGLWLSRQTGIPVAASGGVGWGPSDPGIQPEASRMAEIAQAEYGTPLRWVEATSRDTHENAVNTLALLRPAGVREIVLVTHAAHLPRALREFRAAAATDAGSAPMRITPAAMGQAWPGVSPLLRWLPSSEGALRMRGALHEVLAQLGDRR